MKSQLHHVALNVTDPEWYITFFQEVFSMQIRKSSGTAPNRKIWFHEGIQLNEISNLPEEASSPGHIYDHISIAVEDMAETMENAFRHGCLPGSQGTNWFILPNGAAVELMTL